MARSLHNDVLDAALAEIAEGNLLTLCSAEPTTYTEGSSTFKLADVTLTAGFGNGDFGNPANGTVSGRKMTIAAQTGVTVDSTGTVTHLAILDSSGSRLLAVTVTNSFGVTAAGTVDVPAFDIEIRDPIAP